MRKSGCWIFGVTEEGDVLFGKGDSPMWLFPHVYRPIISEHVTVVECCTYIYEMYELFSVINIHDFKLPLCSKCCMLSFE